MIQYPWPEFYFQFKSGIFEICNVIFNIKNAYTGILTENKLIFGKLFIIKRAKKPFLYVH